MVRRPRRKRPSQPPATEAEQALRDAARIIQIREAAFTYGQMEVWLAMAKRHRSKRGREVCLANAVGFASR